MTLGTYLSLFYEGLKRVVVRSRDGASLVDMSGVGRQLAVEALNAGWAYVAEMEQGLKGYYSDTLVENQSEYEIPEDVLKVTTVRLLNGATLKAELAPTVMDRVLHRDETSEKSAGVPDACAVVLWKFQDSEAARRCLKFDRPPNWGGDDCIEVYCTRRPAFISDDDAEPDMPASLGMAGLHHAQFMISQATQFKTMREEALTAYRMSGVGNEPWGMRSRY